MAKTKPVTAEELGAAMSIADELDHTFLDMIHRLSLASHTELDVKDAIRRLVLLTREAAQLASGLIMVQSHQVTLAGMRESQAKLREMEASK